MKIPELVWSNGSAGSYDDDLLLDITSGTVALLIRGRNAWHGTWVRHYLRNATLYMDVLSAKGGAESQRERGNVFYVVAVPALQLRGSASNIVLCDAHPDSPFGSFTGFGSKVQTSSHGDWIGGIFPGVSVRDAVGVFTHNSGHWSGPTPSAHSLRTGRLETGVALTDGRGKLESFVSEARGVDYFLGWNPYPAGARYNRRGVNAVVRKWQALLHETQTLDVGDEGRHRRFIEVRDQELKALPESVWRSDALERHKDRHSRRSQAADAWVAASEEVGRIEDLLDLAQSELDAAREDRLHPAETSEGIRLQRERLAAAEEEVQRRKTEFADAEQAADTLHAAYMELLISRK